MTDIDSYIDTIEDNNILFNTNHEKLKQYDRDAQYLILNMCKEYPRPIIKHVNYLHTYFCYIIIIIIVFILFIILVTRFRG